MPKPLDPMWEYGQPISGRQKLTCNLCGKKIYGGISRLKYHLAQIPGHEVEICPNSTPEIIQIATKAVELMVSTSVHKEDVRVELRSGGVARDRSFTYTSGRGSESQSSPSTIPSASTTSPFFVSRTSHGSQPGIMSMIKLKEKREADKLVGRCLLWSDVPFSIAKNNPFYQSMFEAVAIVGPGYKAPSYEELRGPVLQNEKADCATRLEDFRASWVRTGCTVMSDGWTDGKGRTLLNFLVHCPRGTMFMKSVDASAHIKDATLLCNLLDAFIGEVGPQHVVQVITDNAANYVAAGRMLMSRYPTLYWTPCAAHCIDLVLEDMGKIDWIKETIDSARSITKYIYNHASVLALMRQFTNNKELVRPAITRFATSFISLQSLLASRLEVKRMFLSDEWLALSYSSRPEGLAIARLVGYNEGFWISVQEVCAIGEPLVRVLRLVDGDKPAMGYLYEAMDRAKEAIRAYYQDKGEEGEVKLAQLWGLIDERWNKTLHRPIHAAGLFLNPAFAYACGFNFDAEVQDGLIECIQRMVPSAEERLKIGSEIEIYKRAALTFSYDMAITSRTTLMPGKFHISFF